MTFSVKVNTFDASSRFFSPSKTEIRTEAPVAMRLAKPKANQKETLKFSYKRIARFFPPEYSTKQMEDAIVRMLEERKREIGAMPAPRRRDDAERG